MPLVNATTASKLQQAVITAFTNNKHMYIVSEKQKKPHIFWYKPCGCQQIGDFIYFQSFLQMYISNRIHV